MARVRRRLAAVPGSDDSIIEVVEDMNAVTVPAAADSMVYAVSMAALTPLLQSMMMLTAAGGESHKRNATTSASLDVTALSALALQVNSLLNRPPVAPGPAVADRTVVDIDRTQRLIVT